MNLAVPFGRPMRSLYFVGLQPRARHRGIGSVPSARITFCSDRIPGSPGAVLFGIAQYIPANAKAVSNISTVLFIRGASERGILMRGEVYSPEVGCATIFNLWITDFFASPNRNTAIVREAGAICFRSSGKRGTAPRPGRVLCDEVGFHAPRSTMCRYGARPDSCRPATFLETQLRKDLNSTTKRG
jgi:hypothetical protein